MSKLVFQDIINAVKDKFPIVSDWEFSNCKNGVMEIRTQKEEIYVKDTAEMIKVMFDEIIRLNEAEITGVIRWNGLSQGMYQV